MPTPAVCASTEAGRGANEVMTASSRIRNTVASGMPVKGVLRMEIWKLAPNVHHGARGRHEVGLADVVPFFFPLDHAANEFG